MFISPASVYKEKVNNNLRGHSDRTKRFPSMLSTLSKKYDQNYTLGFKHK